jgi:hypothetical protein
VGWEDPTEGAMRASSSISAAAIACYATGRTRLPCVTGGGAGSIGGPWLGIGIIGLKRTRPAAGWAEGCAASVPMSASELLLFSAATLHFANRLVRHADKRTQSAAVLIV